MVEQMERRKELACLFSGVAARNPAPLPVHTAIRLHCGNNS
jgi:hypothetical protein